MYSLEYESPIGKLIITALDGRVTGIVFESEAPPAPQGGNHLKSGRDERTGAVLQSCARELDAYFAGELKEFSVPVNPAGTPFRMRVWQALQAIPYGQTISYKELASRIGQPSAIRAVGGANHHNPINIIIPCHRVIGAGGSLTGYGGGLDKKAFLLELERK